LNGALEICHHPCHINVITLDWVHSTLCSIRDQPRCMAKDIPNMGYNLHIFFYRLQENRNIISI
jgi:hypothetical protein